MYLEERRTELAEATLNGHRYRLSHFLRWCNEQALTNLNDLTGRHIHSFRLWRRNDGDLNNVSVKTQMDTLRAFVRFCERIDGAENNLSESVVSPTLADGENERDTMIEPERAAEILSYLNRFQYASFKHVLMRLLWRTGMRTGGARAIDLSDYKPAKSRIELHHRPESDTPLKNGDKGERMVAVTPETVVILDDWIDYHRPDRTDENGREALLTTSHGRASRTTIRETIYRNTRPCVYHGDCPHGRDVESCEARDDRRKTASKCPSSVSPHPVRRGSITHHLSTDVPERVVSDRMDVQRKVLGKHYDERSEAVKVEQRRGYLSNI
jgi:site-specific recombinase XerD